MFKNVHVKLIPYNCPFSVCFSEMNIGVSIILESHRLLECLIYFCAIILLSSEAGMEVDDFSVLTFTIQSNFANSKKPVHTFQLLFG